MDTIKYFLDKVIEHSNGEYYYDRVDDLAEIYKHNDMFPIALVEHNRSLGHFVVKFRIGMSSLEIAKLTRDMAVQDCCLLFDEDFIIDPDYGYLYGEEAAQAFLTRIQNNIQEAQFADAMDGAIYISPEPIFAYGQEYKGKTKLEKLWDMFDDEDEF